MSLDDIITTLAAEDPNRVLPYGFDNPHSYRGYYTDLAFEPATDITVGDMLEAARDALGHTYTGWKGGEFEMSGYSDCWLSMEGSASGESIGQLLLKLMLAAGKDGPVPAPLDARRADVLREAADIVEGDDGWGGPDHADARWSAAKKLRDRAASKAPTSDSVAREETLRLAAAYLVRKYGPTNRAAATLVRLAELETQGRSALVPVTPGPTL